MTNTIQSKDYFCNFKILTSHCYDLKESLSLKSYLSFFRIYKLQTNLSESTHKKNTHLLSLPSLSLSTVSESVERERKKVIHLREE